MQLPLLSLQYKPAEVVTLLGGFFYALLSYFIRKVSRSITSAIIAMINITFSYFVTDSLLHSCEIRGKPPHFTMRSLWNKILS